MPVSSEMASGDPPAVPGFAGASPPRTARRYTPSRGTGRGNKQSQSIMLAEIFGVSRRAAGPPAKGFQREAGDHLTAWLANKTKAARENSRAACYSNTLSWPAGYWQPDTLIFTVVDEDNVEVELAVTVDLGVLNVVVQVWLGLLPTEPSASTT